MLASKEATCKLASIEDTCMHQWRLHACINRGYMPASMGTAGLHQRRRHTGLHQLRIHACINGDYRLASIVASLASLNG